LLLLLLGVFLTDFLNRGATAVLAKPLEMDDLADIVLQKTLAPP
jgi:hypothetical protein